MLYHELTEAEFDADFAQGGQRPPLISATSSSSAWPRSTTTRWQRGAESLRMATAGLPLAAPRLYVQIAKACQHRSGGRGQKSLRAARDAGRAVGWKNLPEVEQQTYFATVKYLGELALHHGDADGALENFVLYAESERSGLETLRTSRISTSARETPCPPCASTTGP